jgi:5'-deoxynucleotidase YfbR-like HD superfamily hydrolase
MLLRTFTGKELDVAHLRPQDIDLRDIAHALAKICRYGGHSLRHYSVAEHSLNVTAMVDAPYKREALLHDGAEAYLGDLVAPVKRLVPEFVLLESRVQLAIATRFNLSLSPLVTTPAQVIKADNVIRLYEMADLMAGCESLRATAESAWSGLNPLPSWGEPESAFLVACERLHIW